ncbi:Uncharacterised protein [uncultured Blautia sp.]|nr:Uncharacterised protein [uncultured Blautia sp.]
MAQEHQYQQDRLLRHGPGVAALVVADVNAPLPGGGEVNAVKRHPLRVNQPQAGHVFHQSSGHHRDGVHLSLSRNTSSCCWMKGIAG